MPFVVTSKCCRDGSCVKVCPKDCIVPGPRRDPKWNSRFYIDTVVCIACGACQLACPRNAIIPQRRAQAEDIYLAKRFFSRGPGYWDYDFDAETQDED